MLVLFVAGALAGCSKIRVTGETVFAPYSMADETALGRQYYRPFQQAQGGRFRTEPRLAAYVSNVGQRVAKVSDRRKLFYEFVVLNNSVPNAWALPGGRFGINRSLLPEMENEAERAAVPSLEVTRAAAWTGYSAFRPFFPTDRPEILARISRQTRPDCCSGSSANDPGFSSP